MEEAGCGAGEYWWRVGRGRRTRRWKRCGGEIHGGRTRSGEGVVPVHGHEEKKMCVCVRSFFIVCTARPNTFCKPKRSCRPKDRTVFSLQNM